MSITMLDIVCAVIWMLAFVIFLVAELVTVNVVSVWFAGGALVSFVIALCGGNIWVQIGAFIVVSFVLLLATRPFVNKFVNKRVEKTNVDGLLGRKCKVLTTIDNLNEQGQVILNGIEWIARSEEESLVLEKDTYVTVVSVEGVKLIVKPWSETDFVKDRK